MNLADQNYVDISDTISKLKQIKTNLNTSNNSLKHFLDDYSDNHSISVDARKSDTEDLIMKYQPIISKIDNLIEDITLEANRVNASIREAKRKEEANKKEEKTNSSRVSRPNRSDEEY